MSDEQQEHPRQQEYVSLVEANNAAINKLATEGVQVNPESVAAEATGRHSAEWFWHLGMLPLIGPDVDHGLLEADPDGHVRATTRRHRDRRLDQRPCPVLLPWGDAVLEIEADCVSSAQMRLLDKCWHVDRHDER